MPNRKKNRYRRWNVIAQQVCTTRGWTSSVGLPLVVTSARSEARAESNARRVWRKKRKLKKGCKLYVSAAEV